MGSEDSNLHERLNYMEEKIDERFNQMADAITRMATHMEKLSQRVADISVINERINQHSEGLKQAREYEVKLDERLDEIEKVMPVVTRFIDRSDKISLAVTILLVSGIVGSFFMFT